MIEPLYTLSGAIVGFVVGLTGVGGGSLMTPLLVLLFGVHPATAVGTDLLYAAITKGAGAVSHGRSNNVEWTIARRLALGSVPASVATLALLSRLGEYSAHVSRAMSVVLGIALVLTALSILFRHRLVRLRGEYALMNERGLAGITIAFGALLGVLVSLSSVGAGAIGVSVLFLLYPTLPAARIVGTDIAHAVPLTFVAGVGHWTIGAVDGVMLASLLLGSIPGILVGSRLAPRVDERLLRMLLAAILFLVGARLLVA